MKIISAKYSAGAINAGALILRLGLGILMIKHGYDKMMHFSMMKTQFISFLGLSPTISLSLAIFAEFFCSALLILGLFTRLATIPLIITMCVALFQMHHGDIYDEHGHLATLFLVGFLGLLFIGPGKISVDGMIGK